MKSLTPPRIKDHLIDVHTVDEYVQTDLSYLNLLKSSGTPVLLALVGVQSHQLHRALDLAAYARAHGSLAVIGGPHAMTCDTEAIQGRGLSVALSEAEMLWEEILTDATTGILKPAYGGESRWQATLDNIVVEPPSRADLKRYVSPLMGLHPARGCPFNCSYCSVVKVAGRKVRNVSVDSIIRSLRLARAAGVKLILFTSDNFNKVPDVYELLHAMIEEQLSIPFLCQVDTQIGDQEELLELMRRAGCLQMFIGVESLDRATLLGVRKTHNHPPQYGRIIELSRKRGIMTHFSNMIGFPPDTPQSIDNQVDGLRELDPDITTFFIMSPIPGTDQYAEFKEADLLAEENLDRYDATCPVWKHPTMSAKQLEDALYRAYSRFYTLSHSIRYFRRNARSSSVKYNLHPAFNRYAAWKRFHPLAGGVWRVFRDHVNDYLPLRRQMFGFDLVPLPDNLKLSKADEALNRQAKLPAMRG